MKFALLVAALFAGTVAALLLIQRTQRQSMADLLESETRERATMLAGAIELTGQALRDFAHDYAQWDDMVQFIAQPKPQWAAINLDASLDNFKLAAVWVLRTDGSLVYATSGEAPAARPPLPLTPVEIQRLIQAPPEHTFFAPHAGRLTELCLAPVQPSEDTRRQSQPLGWLLAARAWDDAQVQLLADLLQCEVNVERPGAPLPPPGPTQVSLRHPLPGLDGRVAADLIYTIRSRELEIVARHHRTQVWLFVLNGLLAGLVALACLQRWVLRPLRAISDSLAGAEAAPIAGLAERRDEIGRVAGLVQTSFAQRAELESMLQERVRLGRELHDGVIQTVYAAGMNLTGARSTLRQNPAEAERILDDTHAELNHTIRDLRSFIAGLEPEPSSHRALGEAIQSILTLMQGVRPVACTLEIDDALAAALGGHERLHLLHIVREAVSNAVRHSTARRLTIQLSRAGDEAVLAITDDGTGLDPALPTETGRGLANLAARAEELGGTCEFDSRSGAGLRVRVAFPVRR